LQSAVHQVTNVTDRRRQEEISGAATGCRKRQFENNPVLRTIDSADLFSKLSALVIHFCHSVILC